jgi:hypothetical protein
MWLSYSPPQLDSHPGSWRCRFSGMWHHVIGWVVYSVLEDDSAFRLLDTEDECTGPFKTSGTICLMTQCHILENLHLQQHCCENFKAFSEEVALHLQILQTASIIKHCCLAWMVLLKQCRKAVMCVIPILWCWCFLFSSPFIVPSVMNICSPYKAICVIFHVLCFH